MLRRRFLTACLLALLTLGLAGCGSGDGDGGGGGSSGAEADLRCNSWTEYTAYSGYWGVRGEFENTGGVKAEYVRINIDLYDDEGNVIGTSFTYVNSTHLEPGQRASFEDVITTSRNDVASVHRYVSWHEESGSYTRDF